MTQRRPQRSPAVMPIAEYVTEAEKLSIMAHRYGVYHEFKLAEPDLSDRIDDQILALKQAERTFIIEQHCQTDHETAWKEAVPKAFDLRYTMLFFLSRAYPNGSPISHEISRILSGTKKNKSISCLTMDLGILGTLWRQAKEPLSKYTIDHTMGDQALFYSENLGRMQTAARLDRMDTHYKILRDNAYLVLKKSVDLLRRMSKMMYRKGSKEYHQFTSDFYRKRNAKAREALKRKAQIKKNKLQKTGEIMVTESREVLTPKEPYIDSLPQVIQSNDADRVAPSKAIANGDSLSMSSSTSLQEQYPLRLLEDGHRLE
ncbi:MAG: hypothetical protein OCD01_16980 [Fibrobacterales bacterium]